MKYVEFYPKNKFQKLVHLVGFIIRYNAVKFILLELRDKHCKLN